MLHYFNLLRAINQWGGNETFGFRLDPRSLKLHFLQFFQAMASRTPRLCPSKSSRSKILMKVISGDNLKWIEIEWQKLYIFNVCHFVKLTFFNCYLGIKPKSQKKLFKILQIGRQLIEADKKRFKSLINLVVEKIGLEVEN